MQTKTFMSDDVCVDASEEGEPSGVFWDPGSKGGRRSLVAVEGFEPPARGL